MLQLKTIQKLFILWLVLGYATSIYAQANEEKNPLVEEQLGIFEHLDETLSDDLMFTNDKGELVNFKASINKPTVISMVYYECPGICTPLLNGLSEVVKKSDLILGTDYDVVSISFDPGETTDLARNKKNNYKKVIKEKDVEHGWTFYTGDQKNITQLLNELGFKVKEDGAEYIHPAAIMVISPEAKITRYLNGVYFLPFDFKMAIVEASEGRSGPTINKVLNYCFSYDPIGKTYVFNITAIAGSFIILIVLLFIMRLIRIERRRPKVN